MDQVLDPIITKEIATLGIGGVIAIIMFYRHRSDMLKLLQESREDRQTLISLVKENTAAVSVLTEIVRNLDADQRSDRLFRVKGIDRRNI